MGRHEDEKEKVAYSKAIHLIQPVLPVLPLRLARRTVISTKAQESVPVARLGKHGNRGLLPSCGTAISDHHLKIQFGDMDGNHDPVFNSSASLNKNVPSVDVVASSLPSDSSEQDISTQATSSWPSSTSPTPSPNGIPLENILHHFQATHNPGPTQTPAIQTPIVQGPALRTVDLQRSVVQPPVAQITALRSSASQAFFSETPLLQTIAPQTSATEPSASQPPLLQAPAVETPIFELPVLQTAIAQLPFSEAPALHNPALRIHARRKSISQTPAVQFPSETSISRSTTLNISFLYQEDLCFASSEPTSTSGSPTVIALPKMSYQPPVPGATLSNPNLTNHPDQQPAGGNAPGAFANPQNPFNAYVPQYNPIYRPDYVVPVAMISISAHILSLFDLQICCDQQIFIHVLANTATEFFFEAHKLIICRSPMLSALMDLDLFNWSYNKCRMDILWPATYFNAKAFSCALRHLYSDTVIGIDEIENTTYAGVDHHITHWRRDQLKFTITYWLAGYLMQASAVVNQAEAIVRNLINFDILNIAWILAADLCDHNPVEFRARAHPENAKYPALHRQEMFAAAEALGNKLKAMIFTFIGFNIAFRDFQLDNGYTSFIKERLPTTREFIASHPNIPPIAVLALQFGTFPMPPLAPQLSMRNRHTSYLMLNLPFPDLKTAVGVLRHVARTANREEDADVKAFIATVVREREERRRIVGSSASVTVEERKADLGAWGVVAFEERVVVEDGEGEGGWTVEAERTPEGVALLGVGE